MSARAMSRWPTPHRPVRQMVAVGLAVVAGLAVPLAVTAHWVDDTLRSGDRFVAAMAPLARDRPFTDAVAAQVTAELYRQLPAAVRRSPPVAGARGTVQQELAATMASPAFRPVWDAATRAAQRQAMAVLSGSRPGRLVAALTGAVVPALRRVPGATGLLPAARALTSGGDLSVELLNAEQLGQARRVFAAVDDAQWWLVAGAAALLVLSLLVATRRWSLLAWFGVAAALATAAAWGALDATGHLAVVQGSGLSLGRPGSEEVFSILVRGLRLDFLLVLTLSGGLAVVAALLGVRNGYRRRQTRYVLRTA